MRRIPCVLAACMAWVGAAAAEEKTVTRTETRQVNFFYDDNACVSSAINVAQNSDEDRKNIVTYLDYTVLDYCQQLYIGDGHVQIPATSLVGDPRTGDEISLRVDLRPIAASVQGTPLIADLVWTKTRDTVTTHESRSVTTSRSRRQRSVTTSNFFSRSAAVTGSANIIAAAALAATSGSISWESVTTRAVSEGAD